MTDQHIGDTRDMSMRDRLDDVIAEAGGFMKNTRIVADIRNAILSELMKPSEAMISYGEGYMDMTVPDAISGRGKVARENEFRVGFVAALQHILDEPQQEDAAA